MRDPPWTSPPLAILDPHSHLAPTPFINQRDAADLVIVLDIIPVIILVVIFAITPEGLGQTLAATAGPLSPFAGDRFLYCPVAVQWRLIRPVHAVAGPVA